MRRRSIYQTRPVPTAQALQQREGADPKPTQNSHFKKVDRDKGAEFDESVIGPTFAAFNGQQSTTLVCEGAYQFGRSARRF